MRVPVFLPVAVDALQKGGSYLDAVELGCTKCEVLQCGDSVGYGGRWVGDARWDVEGIECEAANKRYEREGWARNGTMVD